MKLSKDKITLPGRKQVYRFSDAEGKFEKDMIALADEKVEAEPLLVKVMEKGKLTYALPSLEQIRANAAENLSKLPEEYKALTDAPVYPVELSRNLLNLVKTLKRQLTINEINHVALRRGCLVFLLFLAGSFFVFAAVAVSALPALRRDFVAFLYVLALVKDAVYSLLKTRKQSLSLSPSNRLLACIWSTRYIR